MFFVFRVDKNMRSVPKPKSWLLRRRKRPRPPNRSNGIQFCTLVLLFVCLLFPSTVMHSRTDSVQRLLSWCSLKRINIDERLSVVQDETTGEMSVFNLTEEAIPASQTREYPDYVADLANF